MSIQNPNAPERIHRQPKIILRSEIEEAQKHTNSNNAAARWLNVPYERYRKYAKLYGLFDRHLNPTGLGVEKGYSKKPTSIPLRDILAGKHPNYSLSKLKNRLIARHKLIEQCAVCGLTERRITDGKMPLIILFKDGDNKNFNLDNLHLVCYNCSFYTTGAPSVVNQRTVKKSLMHPEKAPKIQNIEPTTADTYDTIEDMEYEHIELSEEEKQYLLEEIAKS